MTGYGTATGKVGRGRVTLELKTINHRYCDLSLRIPPRMNGLEPKLRDYLQNHFERGKIELFIKEVEPLFGGTELVVNVGLARQYQNSLKKLERSLRMSAHPDFLSLVGVQPFLQAREREGNYLRHLRPILRLLQQAAGHVEKMRITEGNHLLKDQKARLKTMDHLLHHVETRARENSRQRRAVLTAQGPNGNPESGVPTDRMDITEELTRLKSHTRQYGMLLTSREPVGRKLDFLIQEMHREVNTIGAKAADAAISASIVEVKALLENLREQVQNVV